MLSIINFSSFGKQFTTVFEIGAEGALWVYYSSPWRQSIFNYSSSPLKSSIPFIVYYIHYLSFIIQQKYSNSI